MDPFLDVRCIDGPFAIPERNKDLTFALRGFRHVVVGPSVTFVNSYREDFGIRRFEDDDTAMEKLEACSEVVRQNLGHIPVDMWIERDRVLICSTDSDITSLVRDCVKNVMYRPDYDFATSLQRRLPKDIDFVASPSLSIPFRKTQDSLLVGIPLGSFVIRNCDTDVARALHASGTPHVTVLSDVFVRPHKRTVPLLPHLYDRLAWALQGIEDMCRRASEEDRRITVTGVLDGYRGNVDVVSNARQMADAAVTWIEDTQSRLGHWLMCPP